MHCYFDPILSFLLFYYCTAREHYSHVPSYIIFPLLQSITSLLSSIYLYDLRIYHIHLYYLCVSLVPNPNLYHLYLNSISPSLATISTNYLTISTRFYDPFLSTFHLYFFLSERQQIHSHLLGLEPPPTQPILRTLPTVP